MCVEPSCFALCWSGPCATGNKLDIILGSRLQRNVQALTDLRFADDILLFALSPQKDLEMLRSLVLYLRQVGLVLNASKTKLMTTQAQPPDRVWFQADSYIDVVHGNSSHKWFWAVSCPWMVTTLRMLSFIFTRQHLLSGRTDGFCVTGMSHNRFASNFSRPS